jgi:hypothetical protein
VPQPTAPPAACPQATAEPVPKYDECQNCCEVYVVAGN